jgi:hypothetical protein
MINGRLTYEELQALPPGASIEERRGCALHNITLGGAPVNRGGNVEYRTRSRPAASFRSRLAEIERDSRLLNIVTPRK